MPTPHPIAVSPLQTWHVRLGARFAEVDGWRLPTGYTTITEEIAAARTGLAIADISFLTKLSIRGGAPVSAVTERAATGTARPTGGGIPGLVCCLCDDRALLLSARPETIWRDALENASGYRRESVFDVTSAYAGLALFGPRHNGILRELTSFDSDRLAPGSCAETGLAGVHAILVRPPASLPLIHIYIARDLAEFIYERILASALPHPIAPIGTEALKTLWSL